MTATPHHPHPARRIVVPGSAVSTVVSGLGPPLALVHGGTGTAAFDWEFVLRPLSQRFTVVAMDMRGHGRTPAPDGRIGLVRVALDTAAVMQRLGFPRFSAMGFSMGANTLIRLAIDQPSRISHLVTIGASVESYPERIDSILSGPWPTQLRELEHEVAGADPDHWEWLRARLAHDWVDNVAFTDDQLTKVTARVTAIHGSADRIVNPDQARRLATGVTNGKAILVPEAGHAVARDEPEAVIAAVFANSIQAVSGPRPGSGPTYWEG